MTPLRGANQRSDAIKRSSRHHGGHLRRRWPSPRARAARRWRSWRHNLVGTPPRSRKGHSPCWRGPWMCLATRRSRRMRQISRSVFSRQDRAVGAGACLLSKRAHQRGLAERNAMITRAHALPVGWQCQLLAPARSTAFAQLVRCPRLIWADAPDRRAPSGLPICRSGATCCGMTVRGFGVSESAP